MFWVMCIVFCFDRPGPSSPLPWVRDCVLQLAPNAQWRQKILLGLNLYGLDFASQGTEPILGGRWDNTVTTAVNNSFTFFQKLDSYETLLDKCTLIYRPTKCRWAPESNLRHQNLSDFIKELPLEPQMALCNFFFHMCSNTPQILWTDFDL